MHCMSSITALPVGFRLALAYPERVTAIISQKTATPTRKASALVGDPIRAYWENATEENRNNLRAFLHGGHHSVPVSTRENRDLTRIAPDGYTLDQHFLDRPGHRRDPAGPARRLQEQRRGLSKSSRSISARTNLRLLAVWGKNDPFFLPAGCWKPSVAISPMRRFGLVDARPLHARSAC